MGYLGSFLSFLLVSMLLNLSCGQPKVPAIFIFGDSIADVGNNNHLFTLVKANFYPYGRDFKYGIPTGRFCNGKLAFDFIAETLGFSYYQLAYLDLKIKGSNLMNGANFASAASGFYDVLPMSYNTIPSHKQLEYYKEYQTILVETAGQSKASSILSNALYFVTNGNSDFISYYMNPLLHSVFTVDQFGDILLKNYSNFIRNLYALGARRIGVISIPPIGCLPIILTFIGSYTNECVAKINDDVIHYNKKLNYISHNLRKMLPNLNLVVIDIYEPLYNIITKPYEYGFFEARKGCCGTGLVEVFELCNKRSIGTCANASDYVFWDAVHATEATNKILAHHVIDVVMSKHLI